MVFKTRPQILSCNIRNRGLIQIPSYSNNLQKGIPQNDTRLSQD